MKKRYPVILILLILITLMETACSSGNRIGGTSKKCGCGTTKGMVGY
jgi:hypothetical protein